VLRWPFLVVSLLLGASATSCRSGTEAPPEGPPSLPSPTTFRGLRFDLLAVNGQRLPATADLPIALRGLSDTLVAVRIQSGRLAFRADADSVDWSLPQLVGVELTLRRSEISRTVRISYAASDSIALGGEFIPGVGEIRPFGYARLQGDTLMVRTSMPTLFLGNRPVPLPAELVNPFGVHVYHFVRAR
jgi:hypothetical protein